ncbi:MAG: alpha-hydroxy-acid oxidizing enzyme [Rhizobiales bacterium]|nr:alpha-hydroxy-acid oxidizing enzyme [Hyphomicrobiales bacterium]MBA68445.1 alpha-hydroxy-acid oxidizing enzyme [Hyphomicrobiales bacterium]|tara:strand:- start:754 stop:1941 length:1188 start_codon:yes stop_codon:yes gene_type:complete
MYAVTTKPPARGDAARRAANLAEFEQHARRILPPALFHYVAGASEDGAVHERNLRAFRERAFVPNVLVDVSGRSTATSLFGKDYAAPFGIAPMGFSRMIARDGDITLARAAEAAGVPFILSGASLTAMEAVQKAAPSSWFQAYLPGEDDRINGLVDRVAAAGFGTLVLTADTAVHPLHERAARHGFVSPVRKGDLRLAWQGASHPRWLWQVLLSDGMAGLGYRFENMDASAGPPVLSSTLVRDIGRRDAFSWRHVELVRKRWTGKLLIKGIMSAADAAAAEKAGVDGVIISNHGGRQIDCSIAALDALCRITDRGLAIPVLYDGGVRRGSDVLKALKAGADFVFVGRPMLLAAAAGGTRGVAHAIDLLTREVSMNMALLGINSPGEIGNVEMIRE